MVVKKVVIENPEENVNTRDVLMKILKKNNCEIGSVHSYRVS